MNVYAAQHRPSRSRLVALGSTDLTTRYGRCTDHGMERGFLSALQTPDIFILVSILLHAQAHCEAHCMRTLTVPNCTRGSQQAASSL